MARVLFNKRLSDGDQESVEGKGKAKAEDDSPEVRHIKERLADTHDLLAEISLENERYVAAGVATSPSSRSRARLTSHVL